MAKQPRATLASIAAASGVSRQTVSNVLNAPDKVSPDTRRRVEQAIAKARYRPSAAGRALRRQRADTVALRMFRVGDGINGAVLDRFLHELVAAAEASHYRVLLFTADTAEDEVATLVDLAHRGVVDGCVLTDTVAGDKRPRALQAAGVPFVAFGRPWLDEDAGHSWVDIDGAHGTAEATRRLIASGQEPVGWLGWPAPSGVGADRRAGWASVVGRGGLEESCDDGIAQARAAMGALLDRGARSVVCASDSLAVGALLAWRDRFGEVVDGDRWPVVGFDDTPLARFGRFSSIAQPVEVAARHCFRLLVGQLDQPRTPHEEVLLEPTVILRATEERIPTSLHGSTN